MNLKKVCCICIILAAWVMSLNHLLMKKKKKTQTTQISINKTFPSN